MRPHMPKGIAPPDSQGDLDFLSQLIGSSTICLIHHENVRDLHHTGLQGLDAVARLRHQHKNRGIRHPAHVQLRLTHTHGFDQNAVEARSIEQVADLTGGGGESSEGATAGHRADVDTLIERDGFHSDPIAQEGPTGERAGRIDRHDGHLQPGRAVLRHEPFDQSGFPGAGRASDPDATSPAERSVNFTEQTLEAGPCVLDHRDRPSQCGSLARHQLGDKKVEIHAERSPQARGQASCRNAARFDS